MRTRSVCLLTLLTFATSAAYSQGTLIYDQESSTDEMTFTGGVHIQFYSSVGQSFTPSLSALGFVRLRFFDINPGNGIGATLVVNLRSDSMTGPLLGSSSPLALADGYGYTGATNFLFTTAVPVIPNSTYFLEIVAQSGDSWGILALTDTYAGGTFFGSGFPYSASDLWFRSGIIVPEPSALALFFGGVAAVWFVGKRRSN